ncbi:hypothetical protein [Spiroplasma poulsonii]|uniref:hypothetical protein n=1 Tax=Spiroplasma poulsonii TaxID=2138 RepID=UPI001F4CB660|nr:hypothetical protein [Spiroplasma poulsonii]UNF62438.1 hypothetical protein MNU24_02935 [Spiroplasma poulsonii]
MIIIHYSSWRLKLWILTNKIKVNEQLRLEQLILEEQESGAEGSSGNTSGSIFARYIDIMQATDIIQPTKLLGGVVDLQTLLVQKDIQTQAASFEYHIIYLIKKAYKVAEYTHSNATNMFRRTIRTSGRYFCRVFTNNQLNQ